MRVYTTICLPFLFLSTVSSKLLSVNFSGDSVKQLRKRFFINFMSEKLSSEDAVEIGINKYMVASLCRLGNNAISKS